jgi:hypothetical protein
MTRARSADLTMSSVIYTIVLEIARSGREEALCGHSAAVIGQNVADSEMSLIGGGDPSGRAWQRCGRVTLLSDMLRKRGGAVDSQISTTMFAYLDGS